MHIGIRDGLPLHEYLASPGISKSGLSRYADSPARFRHGPAQKTRSMAFGSLIHTAILEPDQLEHRYQTSQLRAFNETHKAYQAEMTAALGRELVKQAEMDEARRIADAVHAHPIGAALITRDLIVERSFTWRDRATGVLCRGRSDGIDRVRRIVFDVKSCEDATPARFARACFDYRYHWQVPMYCDGLLEADGWQPDAFIFVAVEKEPPYLVGAYELRPCDVALGQEAVARWLPRYAESLRTDTWPGLSDHIEPLSLPAFAFPRPSPPDDHTTSIQHSRSLASLRAPLPPSLSPRERHQDPAQQPPPPGSGGGSGGRPPTSGPAITFTGGNAPATVFTIAAEPTAQPAPPAPAIPAATAKSPGDLQGAGGFGDCE